MGVNNLKRLPITRVLEDKGLLGYMKQRHGQLFGPCPVHGGDNPVPSWSPWKKTSGIALLNVMWEAMSFG